MRWTAPTGAAWVSPATSGMPKIRRRPRSPSRSYDWQGLGLGTELLARLSDRARQAGIRRFTGLVAEDNQAMAGLLGNLCAQIVGRGPGTVEYEIALAPAASPVTSRT